MNLYSLLSEKIFSAMFELKITPKEKIDLIFDGNIHRFATEQDKYGEKSGAYYIHLDGFPNFGIMDYRQHNEMQKYKLSREDFNETEIFNFHGRREKSPRVDNSQKAFGEFSRGSVEEVKNHPYIKLKKLKHFGMSRVCVSHREGDICNVGDLMIPLFNISTKKFQSLQRITAKTLSNGKHMKGIYPSTVLKGSFTPFYIENPERIIVCEGFATGSSIFTFSRHRNFVISAMSCNNLVNITSSLNTNLSVFIGADNDEAGIRCAAECVSNGYAENYFAPPIPGQDWNDFLICSRY